VKVLLDTNILTRMVQPAHPVHRIATGAVDALRRRGDQLCVVPQNLYEFWVVATRPTQDNGMGLTTSQAAAELGNVKSLFTFLMDMPELYSKWENLVSTLDVKGKPAHDARLVAAMQVHAIEGLLTFDSSDFARYPGVVVLAPASVVAPP
jgi:predicted nucleic acid-binding protein